MTLTTVQTYKATDGELFEDRGEALKHQLAVDLQGIINRATADRKLGGGTFSPAKVFAHEADEVYEKLLSYRRKMQAYNKNKK